MLNKVFSDYLSMQMATSKILQDVSQNFYVQRKHIAGVRELCLLQARFNKFMGKSPFSLVRHARFLSALKLLELRVKLNEVKTENVVWWDQFHRCPDSEKIHMVNVMKGKVGQRRSDKKRRKKKLSTT